MLGRIAFIFFSLMLAASDPAHSATVHWELSDVTFRDGATASGSFDFDFASSTFTNVHISTAGSPQGEFNRTWEFISGTASFMYLNRGGVFLTMPGADDSALLFNFTPLAPDLLISSILVGNCGMYADCNGLIAARCDYLTVGRFLNETISYVPLPATLPLFAAGLFALGLLGRLGRTH